MSLAEAQDYFCRLCLSKKYLISLCKGQSKKYKYLRKIIFLTVGVKIEKNDPTSKCVCLSCAIKGFNFYKFQHISQQTHLKLMKTKLNSKLKLQNTVEDILLPDSDIVFDYVQSWLERKRVECLKKQRKAIGKNTIRDNLNDDVKLTKIISVETQTVIEQVTKEVQTEKHCMLHQLVQTDYLPFENTETRTTQTEKHYTHHQSVQTDYSSFENAETRNYKLFKSSSETDSGCPTEYSDNYSIYKDSTPKKEEYDEENSKIGLLKTEIIIDAPEVDSDYPQFSDVPLNNFFTNFPLTSELFLNEQKENEFSKNIETDSVLDSPNLVLIKEVKLETCKICGISLSNKFEYKKHLKAHMRCCLCKKTFNSIKLTNVHVCPKKIPLKECSVHLRRIDNIPI